MGRQHQQRGTELTEIDCLSLRRIVSTNHTTTAAQVTAELNILLFSQKLSKRELHKSNIYGRAAIAKPLTTESNARMRKRWCHGHKIRTSDNWKCVHNMDR
jgi:hypothetical protein